MKTRPRWWQALLMVALATGGTLVVAEPGLRLYYWSKGIGRGDVRELLLRSQHAELQELGKGGGLHGLLRPSPIPDTVYEMKPHLRGTFRGERLETNAWGLRGPAVQRDKAAGVIRVAGLGDSHMFGWGMPQEAGYMALLQRELDAHARPGVRFEVLNFGTPGYNTVMEAAVFEHKALTFAPDFAEYFMRLLAGTGREVTPESFRETFSRDDLHPTHLGHRAYARALRCELAYLGLPGLATQATLDCPPQQTVAPRDTGARTRTGVRARRDRS